MNINDVQCDPNQPAQPCNLIIAFFVDILQYPQILSAGNGYIFIHLKEKAKGSKFFFRKHAYIILTPLNPTFIVKLGFTGVYIIFLFCSKTWIVGTRYNSLIEGVLTSTYNLCFKQKYEKYQIFFT